jgi:hypothetical protein
MAQVFNNMLGVAAAMFACANNADPYFTVDHKFSSD